MKSMRPVVISAVAVGLAVASPVLWVQSAKGQAAETSAVQGESTLADLLRGLESRSRDSHSTFDTTIRFDGDLDVGRRSMLLEGEVHDGSTGGFFQLVASVEDEMDIRTITLFPRSISMQVIFISEFDPNDPNVFDRISGFCHVGLGDGSVSHYPDPPIRLRKGDAIIVAGSRSVPSGNAFAGLALRGTVPVPSGGSGDLLRVQ
jgi:hypothetical protein